MKTPTHLIILSLIIVSGMAACENHPATQADLTKTYVRDFTQVPLRERLLTVGEQKALIPDSVIQILNNGNKRFMSNDLTARNHSVMIKNGSFRSIPKGNRSFLCRQPGAGRRCV